ncbi:Right handed beta helix region [Limimonas halophila]|uniref:Right handed beta helix region n=1 Tax=Limimonas halophila TaxID=1082479 RepID=A0A1G7NUS5_9PROT|nr:right-handed parallel beta-helix repeat-containing protein [Limimonas halophila]SDF77693.1 Right handed beta helix region [Limimonas halophila]
MERAFARARSGAEIVLAPGRYGTVSLTRKAFDDPIVVRSRQPWSAVLTTLRLRDVHGVEIRGVRIDAAGRPSGRYAKPRNAAIEITRSSRIRLTQNQIRGTPDGDFENDRMGVFVSKSTNIRVERNEIHNVLIGARFRETDHLKVVRNSVSDVAKDGMNFVGVRHVCIANNWVFATHPNEVAHTDFIQFWNTKSDVPTSDVILRGNILFQNNVHSTQALFIGDPPPSGYARFTIDHNVIYTSAFHGITASGLRDSSINNNTVITYPRLQWRAHISTEGQNLRVAGNVTTGLRLGTGVTAGGNMKVQSRDSNADGYYGAVFADGFARSRVVPDLLLPPEGAAAPRATKAGATTHLQAMLAGGALPGCETS